MAKANSTRRKAGPSLSPKPRSLALVKQASDEALNRFREAHDELYDHPESAREREPQERQARLHKLWEDAAKAAPTLPAITNPLIDNMGSVGTIASVREVMELLEWSKMVDDHSSEATEDARGRIHQWLKETLVYAEAQIEREHDMACEVISRLQGGEQP